MSNLFLDSDKIVKNSSVLNENLQRIVKKPFVPSKLNLQPRPGQKRLICCNCKKSQCLKLYCECFANKVFCQGCNCVSCANIKENKVERDKAMRTTLERNPVAFDPKIACDDNSEVNDMLKHSRGCHCKKSGCQKKYCECYQSGVKCTELCKCESCLNKSEDEPNTITPNKIEIVEEKVTPIVGGKRRKPDKSGEKVIGIKRTAERLRRISTKEFILGKEDNSKKDRLRSGFSTRSTKRNIIN